MPHPTSTSSPKVSKNLKDKTNASKPKPGKKQKLKSTPIKIMNINCQSVKSKRDQFLTMLETEIPDVVVGTESWLNHRRMGRGGRGGTVPPQIF